VGFSFVVVGRGELLMLLLPFKAMLVPVARAQPKIWRPTAARTFFQGPEEYCS
jgi:hypothetical protein